MGRDTWSGLQLRVPFVMILYFGTVTRHVDVGRTHFEGDGYTGNTKSTESYRRGN